MLRREGAVARTAGPGGRHPRPVDQLRRQVNAIAERPRTKLGLGAGARLGHGARA